MRSEFYNEIEISRKRFMDEVNFGSAHVLKNSSTEQKQEADNSQKAVNSQSKLNRQEEISQEAKNTISEKRPIQTEASPNINDDLKTKTRISNLKEYFLEKSITFFQFEE